MSKYGILNPLDKKLVNITSVQCSSLYSANGLQTLQYQQPPTPPILPAVIPRHRFLKLAEFCVPFVNFSFWIGLKQCDHLDPNFVRLLEMHLVKNYIYRMRAIITRS